MASADQLPKYDLHPLEYVHPLESTAIRSDFLVSNGTKHKLQEMRRTIQNEVDRLDQEIARQNVLLRGLQEQRTTFISRITGITCAIVPHKHLPPELLSEIFSLCEDGSSVVVPPMVNDIRRPCWVLGRVCSRWRNIALRMPELWESITIGSGVYGALPSVDRLIAFDAYLRCGLNTLTIKLGSIWQNRNLPLSQEPLLCLLYQYADQLKHLSLSCPLPISESLLDLSPPSFSLLTSVSIIIQPYGGLSTLTLPSEPRLFKDSPHLTSLHIDTNFQWNLCALLPINFGRPWVHLTGISFSGYSILIGLEATHALFLHCTKLTQCTLYVFRAQNDPSDEVLQHRDTIVLPQFQSLKITLKNVQRPSSFLRPMVLPSLQFFTLHSERADQDEGLTPLIACFGSHLQHLTLDLEMTQSQELLLTSLSPALRELSTPRTSINPAMMASIAVGTLLPELKTIACRITSLNSLDAFVNLINCRWGTETDAITDITTAIAYRLPLLMPGPGTEDLWNQMNWCFDDLNKRYLGHDRRIEVRPLNEVFY